MEWSYAKVPGSSSEIDSLVGHLLEIYGLLLFASPFLAALPELFSWIASKIRKNGSLNADMISLTIIMVFSAVSCTICSAQMTYRVLFSKDNENFIFIFLGERFK